MTDSVYSNRGDYAGNNSANALNFIVRSIIRGMVSTAIPVRIDAVYPGDDGAAGYVSATPLVCPIDSQGKAVQPVSIPKLPFFRYYAGRVAIICDPVVGDIGLAVFAQQDASTVVKGTQTPQQPGSFRCYDMSDGFYLGGFYNGAADTKITLDQGGSIAIDCPSTVSIKCVTALVSASGSITFQTPSATFSGDVSISGKLTCAGSTIGGIEFGSHTHSGVETGPGNTGGPQ